MRNNIIVLCCFTVFIFINIKASSQGSENKKLTLNSLEGLPVKVNVELDNVNDRIIVTLSSLESICVSGYRDLTQNIKVIKQKFILFHYRVRGGSGIKVERVMLVCVSKDHLFKAIDVVSMHSYKLHETYDKETDSLGLYNESSIYKLSFIYDQFSKEASNQLTAIQYDKIKSKHDATKNHETLDTLKFNFDSKNKVFCTGYGTLKGSYMVAGNSNKQTIIKQNKYPIIKLKNVEYIFIDGVWYSKVRGNHLMESSPNCK